MELRQLLYFVSVAKHLNFSRAAEDLRVAQPAISQQIRVLENNLGVQLFDRLGRRTALTRAGEVLLPHAQRVLAAVDAGRNELRDMGQLVRGSASLGAPPTVSSYILPDLLTQFKTLYPGLEVSLREAGTESLLELIEEGTLDLAILVTDVLSPVVEVSPFLKEAYVLAVGANHPLCGEGSINLADLSTEPFILFPEGYRLREVTLTACRRAGFSPRVALDGGAMQSALQFVAAGLGVALVPELALSRARDIRGLRIADQDLRRELGVVWRKDHYLSPAARTLRDFIESPGLNVR
jgi:LysR family transcriptional regulator, transcription activator of glutamate synthase operon